MRKVAFSEGFKTSNNGVQKCWENFGIVGYPAGGRVESGCSECFHGEGFDDYEEREGCFGSG